jgi:hypothetical protein
MTGVPDLFDNRMGFDWGLTPVPYGPEWRLARKLLHEQFNRHEVAQYAAQLEASTRVMLQDLLNAPDDFFIHAHWLVLHRYLRCLHHNTSSRWSARIVVDLGYGIDIGDDDWYITLATRNNEYFSLGIEPFRWLVDSLPLCAQFQLLITWWRPHLTAPL